LITTQDIQNKSPSKKPVQRVTPAAKMPIPARFLPVGLALLSGSLLFLSFPRWELYLLAWIAFVPLFFSIRKQSLPKSFFLGWVAGVVYFAGTLSWVTISMHNYGKIPWIISYLLMLLLVSYLAAYVGLFSALLRFTAQRRNGLILLLAPPLWTTLEWMRGHLLTGFPWADLAYSQYRFLPIIQIADIGSVYAVAFVMLLVNAGVFLVLQAAWTEKRMAFRELAIVSSAVLLTLAYGTFRLSQPMGLNQTVSVAVIQGNIEQDKKWDKEFRDQTVQTYKRLTLSALQTGSRPELVVWPESAVPFFYATEPGYQAEFIRLTQKEKFYLLFGSPAFEPAAAGKVALLNSAYLLSPVTQAASRYDKMHLVPFGEYVPLSSLLFFVNKLVEGIGEFIPGRQATVMDAASAKVGTVICFEVIFPEVVRQFIQNGATIMTTITNDAWFGDSAAPHQHFSMVAFRAIENRVPFARAANTGISGFIDAHGNITKRTPLFVEAALTEALRPGFRTTLYTAYGDFFALICATITFIFIAVTFMRRRKNHAD
jgi:apolipoprotein N-acyltransferase